MSSVIYIGLGAQKAGTSWIYKCLRKLPQFQHGFAKEYHVLRERIFLESVDSLTLGYVLIVAIPSAGGELTVLSIVRTSLDDMDVWEEKIVNDFLRISD